MTLVAAMPDIWTDARGAILAALEEASGRRISVINSHVDTLIVNAQEIGMTPRELRTWIYDNCARPDWSAESLKRWARRYGFARNGGQERS